MERISVLFVLMAATLWGSGGVFVNLLTAEGLTSPQMAVLRLVFVLVFTGVALLISGKKNFKIDHRDIIWFALNGVFGVFAFTICYTYTIQLTSMATAAVLIYLMPSLVMVFSVVFLGEKLTPRRVGCLVLSFVGCALVSGVAGGIAITPLGLLMGIMAALCYTAYNTITPVKLSKYSSLTTMFYTFLFAAPAATVFGLLVGDMPAAVAVYAAKPHTIAINLLMGVVCSVAPYWLYNTAVKHISASRAAIAATFEPVAAAILGLVLFAETLNVYSLLGIGCELAALILLQLPQRAKPSHSPEKALKG